MSLVADVPLDAEVDAKTNAAVGIVRAFSFISSEKDSREAFDWLLKVSGTVLIFVEMVLNCLTLDMLFSILKAA